MPTMTASTGIFSVWGVMRALEPWTIRTISPCPAPTVSTTTKVRPTGMRRSRPSGSTRSGSTVSSLWPVIEATFWVDTTLPVTLASNIGTSRAKQIAGLAGNNQFLVGRHDPDLNPALIAVHRRLPLGLSISNGVERDAEPIETRAHFATDRGRILTDAARKNDCVGAVEKKQVGAEVVTHRGDEYVQRLSRPKGTSFCRFFQV